MLNFSRSKNVGVQIQNDNTWVAHGRLDDALYTVDLTIRVSRPDLVIESADARLWRYTTIRCRLGEAFAGRVVGESIGVGLNRRIKDEVGKLGCRHLANLFVDCVQAVARAELLDFFNQSREKAPELAPAAALAAFSERFPQLAQYVRAV